MVSAQTEVQTTEFLSFKKRQNKDVWYLGSQYTCLHSSFQIPTLINILERTLYYIAYYLKKFKALSSLSTFI